MKILLRRIYIYPMSIYFGFQVWIVQIPYVQASSWKSRLANHCSRIQISVPYNTLSYGVRLVNNGVTVADRTHTYQAACIVYPVLFPHCLLIVIALFHGEGTSSERLVAHKKLSNFALWLWGTKYTGNLRSPKASFCRSFTFLANAICSILVSLIP